MTSFRKQRLHDALSLVAMVAFLVVTCSALDRLSRAPLTPGAVALAEVEGR